MTLKYSALDDYVTVCPCRYILLNYLFLFCSAALRAPVVRRLDYNREWGVEEVAL
jgi:hypothetical protein